jgi:hypothetical protein
VIFLYPSQHETVESGEDFLVPATEAPLRIFPAGGPILVPVRQLDGLVDKAAGATLARKEEAHCVLLVYRPD